MSYEHLTPRERMLIERAHSQALYFAQRGLADHLRLEVPELAPATRSKITGIVGTFLHAYVVPELGAVVSESRDRAALPIHHVNSNQGR